MGRISEVKEAIKKTPPEKLAKIEYQSHFMQMLGVTAVCGILIWKGFWWIIFAFIFSLGISLSQGISAYQKYIAILPYMEKKEYNPHEDKSPSRRRDYIIKQILGKYSWMVAIVMALIVNFAFVPYDTWYFKILFTFTLLCSYVFIYFFAFFWEANRWWKK